ncbi:helix-turn-helix transcriptional regulator [uncultured Adlercreutzia sp.]|uniref:helix-turn-helix transcriptional regulator n=1 Tax=uncultured Adlercreutzia sp. TaxID=875803 RepID=UPI0025F9F48A|nr:helix-turn-helix transcriptional regulator [uncultured Adlercreutzia sp.]MCI9261104.1 helix-turn-helix transcriptional regulator [Eggerthellaceae bacterium]
MPLSKGNKTGHGHGGDVGLSSLTAYFFCISALVSLRSLRLGETTDEGALVSFLAFLGTACLTLLFLALAEPYLMHRNPQRLMGRAAALLLALGPVYCAGESLMHQSNTWIMFLMFCLSGCGYGCCLLVWGRVLAAKDVTASARQVFADTCAALIVMVMAMLLPEAAAMALMAVLGLLAGLVGAREVKGLGPGIATEGQVVVSDTRNAIPKSSFFVGATLWMVYGIFWALLGDRSFSAGGDGFLLAVAAVTLALAGIALVRLHRRPGIDLSRAFWVTVPLLVTALVFFVTGETQLVRVATVLIVLSMVVSYLHLMSHFAALAHRPDLLPDQMFAWGWLAPYAGMFGGVFAGVLFRAAGNDVTNFFLPIAAGFLVVAVIASMHSIERIADRRREREVQKVRALAQEEAVDVAVQMDGVFEAMGLSLREKDVASLLLQGHSQAAIAGQLFVAASTVNTHVKHIYRKATVNSKQEFIDLCQERLEATRGKNEAL